MRETSNTPSVPHGTAQQAGLARWRAKQAEEKRLKMEELAFYRMYATTEIRDGREFTLVRIPDRYEWRREAA